MSSRLEEFDHLKIKMEDILSATNNFSPDKFIGGGGFGPVYKGKLSLPGGPTMVAFKRLDPTLGQGNTEFWKEIMLLSRYKHENLVSLLHFGIEGKERVLVYEYVSHGSLDCYLSDPRLTWNQRLDICIGAAKALKYLHDPHETQQRVLHRDIKSSNILLDEKWTAKVSDFGLSKIGPANQPQTFLISNAVGTTGYCDPTYLETGILSKESDVYSFGVVLFEVMCGTLCTQIDNNGNLSGILVRHWKKCCRENKVNDIIFKDIEEQMAPDSLITFSTIANRCLMIDSTQRPTMEEIVKELEVALEQNIYQDSDLVNISKLGVSPLPYRSHEELISIFSNGILVDEGKRWVSINKNQEIIEMISATECIHGEGLQLEKNFTGRPFGMRSRSRFSHILERSSLSNDPVLIVQVRTRFLIPHITYTINLVFDQTFNHDEWWIDLPFKYKLEDETHYSTTRNVQRRDRWLTAELYQFTSHQKEHDFKFELCPLYSGRNECQFEGITFRPMEHEKSENLEDRDLQQISNLDLDWEETLLSNYEDLINLSQENVEWTTKEELYFLLRKGFLIANGEDKSSYLWFCISKTMKLRLMVPARAFLMEENWIWKSHPESRFEVVAESLDTNRLAIVFQIDTNLLFLDTTFSCRLIYKLPENYSLLKKLININRTDDGEYFHSCFFFVPHHPTPIIPSVVEQNYVRPLCIPKVKGHPKLRTDGWLELPLFELSNKDIQDNDTIHMRFDCYGSKKLQFAGLVIQGIELREL